MTDHEAKENVDENCFFTPSNANKFDADSDAECFYSAEKGNNDQFNSVYLLRGTPIRALYSLGGTPMKETRPSNLFSGRKSKRFAKRANLNLNDTIVNEPVVETKDALDLSTLDDVIRDIETVTKPETDVTIINEVNVDSTGVVIAESVDVPLIHVEDDNKDDNETDVENNLEFKAVNTDELNDEHKKSEESMNKSVRSSYIVQSPVVVRNVHFGSAGKKDIEQNVTPPNLVSKINNKIKTRQATPMFQTNMPKDRLARIQKYIKRFSRTPTNEQENLKPETNVCKTEVKPNKNVAFKETKMKKTTTSTTLNHRLTISSRPSTVPRYRSLAEMSSNFLLSTRNYEPPKIKLDKSGKLPLTKPRAPKLLTMQRAQSFRMKTKPETEVDAPKVEPKRQTIAPRKTVTTLQKVKPTKAVTPKFCTDIRQRIWNMKHVKQVEPKTEPANNCVFKARPMPNFKKPTAAATINDKHRLIKTKPFSFDSRITQKSSK